MTLTQEQKNLLCQDGFVLLPGSVPGALVARALRAINCSLGARGLPPGRLSTFDAQSFCPELRSSPVIQELLTKTPLGSMTESAIGLGQVRQISPAQIALRVPNMAKPRAPTPHLDGTSVPHNGVAPGTLVTFTALIGVFLSNLSGEDAGNLTVWPGTHHLYQDDFRQHGPGALRDGMPPIDLPAAQQIEAQAGDAVLCHYQLAHSVASNTSPHIRYAVYFRLIHADHGRLHLVVHPPSLT